MAQVTEKDLRTEIEDMRERFPHLKDDALFVGWFMKCFVTDTEGEAVASLVGGKDETRHLGNSVGVRELVTLSEQWN